MDGLGVAANACLTTEYWLLAFPADIFSPFLSDITFKVLAGVCDFTQVSPTGPMPSFNAARLMLSLVRRCMGQCCSTPRKTLVWLRLWYIVPLSKNQVMETEICWNHLENIRRGGWQKLFWP